MVPAGLHRQLKRILGGHCQLVHDTYQREINRLETTISIERGHFENTKREMHAQVRALMDEMNELRAAIHAGNHGGR